MLEEYKRIKKVGVTMACLLGLSHFWCFKCELFVTKIS